MQLHADPLQGVSFTVYVREDTSMCVFTGRRWKPATGSDRGLGRVMLDLGRHDLAGLPPSLVVRRIAGAVVRAIPLAADRPKAPAPPDGGHGGEQVPGQLAFDLLE